MIYDERRTDSVPVTETVDREFDIEYIKFMLNNNIDLENRVIYLDKSNFDLFKLMMYFSILSDTDDSIKIVVHDLRILNNVKCNEIVNYLSQFSERLTLVLRGTLSYTDNADKLFDKFLTCFNEKYSSVTSRILCWDSIDSFDIRFDGEQLTKLNFKQL